MLHDLWYRLRSLVRRRDVEGNLDEEIRFHIERQIEFLMDSGVAPDEARRRARVMFGGVDAVKEECREARGVFLVETTTQDAQYGLRALGRSPLFTLTALATLSLGIGAVSTVLTLADALLFRPLPVPHPDGIVEVAVTRNHGTTRGFASYPDYVHFRDATRVEDLAAYYPTAPLFVSAGNRAEEINGSVVSWNLFPLVGVQPARGRFFRADEDRVPGRDRVAVVSDAFWRDWLGASAGALGEKIRINGIAFEVIGIMPPGFHGLATSPSHIYIPTMMLEAGYRWCDDALAEDCTTLKMIGRLAPGTSVAGAQAELTAALPARWAGAADGDNSGIVVEVPRGTGSGESDRRMVALLAAVSGLLLLVCCANLAGLLVARSSARARELAMRTALGASAARLVRQLLTESLLLAAAGGLGGVALSVVMTAALNRWFYSTDTAGRPVLIDFALQPHVIGVVVAIAVGAWLLFSFAPALGAIRAGASESLKRRSAASTGPSSAGRWLLGVQAACAVTFIATAGLLVVSARTFVEGSGFEPAHVAQVRLRPRLVEYPPERAQAFLHAAVDRLSSLPGVEAVSLVGTGGVVSGLEADVRMPGTGDAPFRVGYIEVGPDYFDVVGTPIVRGRDFEAADRSGAQPVAIVSEALARFFWPDASPIDRLVEVDGQPRRIVGVVGDVRFQSRTEAVKPYVFTPFWQNPSEIDARVPVRVSGDPDAMLPALARAVHEVDPAVPIGDLVTLPAQLAGNFVAIRMSAAFTAYAGGLAVLLCGIGLYGNLAFSVSRRTREIGIRVAIGASPGRILTSILSQAMPVALAGAGVGLMFSFGATRLLAHVLAGAATGDAVVCGAAAVVVSAVGLAAAWVPARRAARIEPTVALRVE
jgi:putative ABC transport system permease protein